MNKPINERLPFRMHIPAYFINLDRSPARKRHMETMAENAGVILHRFPAICANDLSDQEFRSWHPAGCSDYALTKGEVCCFLSHMGLWKIAAASNSSFTAIFEDDINLSPSVRSFLANDDWIPDCVEFLQLETALHKTVVTRKRIKTHDNRTIYQLAGGHWGSAGYIISKPMAQKMLDLPKQIHMPVDVALFEPDKKFMPDMTAWQISPSFCIQQQFSKHQFLPKDAKLSYLNAQRTMNEAAKRRGVAKLIHEVRRPFSQGSQHISSFLKGARTIKALFR